MKNNSSRPYISAYPLKAITQETSKLEAGPSPYLKAVLSSKLKESASARILPMNDSNLAAALRYIASTK
jgi:hypothetical protein